MADNLENEIPNSTQQGPPHEALFLTLTYLPLLELLSISETCTSIRDAVLSDVLPWLRITVNCPLKNRLTDKMLMKYAFKANGGLRSLVLIKCTKMTDDGLQQILEQNPFISKLHVPGCTGLTPDGIVTAVKKLSKHSPNLTSLKINGIYNINRQHLQTLRSILMANLEHGNQFPNPNRFVSSKHEENDPPIDVGICPICDQVRLVFACSKEDCTRKRNRGASTCRGCLYCVARCVDCGNCIDDGEEEAEIGVACEDNLCLECWLKLPKCILCNKPYCKDHAELRYVHATSDGLVCGGCVAKFLWPFSYV